MSALFGQDLAQSTEHDDRAEGDGGGKQRDE